MMRVLFIGEAEREAAHKLVEFASRPENHYRPGPGAKIPGDDPHYVLKLGTYRCVFTFTVAKPSTDVVHEALYRHLTISIPRQGAYPHPAAVEEIAHLFGFKGKVGEWQVSIVESERCIGVVQKV